MISSMHDSSLNWRIRPNREHLWCRPCRADWKRSDTMASKNAFQISQGREERQRSTTIECFHPQGAAINDWSQSHLCLLLCSSKLCSLALWLVQGSKHRPSRQTMPKLSARRSAPTSTAFVASKARNEWLRFATSAHSSNSNQLWHRSSKRIRRRAWVGVWRRWDLTRVVKKLPLSLISSERSGETRCRRR